jgi:hypothetical protein
MNPLVQRRAAVLLSVAGLLLVVRYGIVSPTGWPHWLHHLIHLVIAWPLAVGTWWLFRAGGGNLLRSAAALFAVWALGETVVAAATAVWEGMLARSAIPAGLHAVEFVLYLAYLATLALGGALLRRPGVLRWAGVALLAAVVVDVVLVPWAAGIGVMCAGVGLYVAASDRRSGAPRPVPPATA